MNDLQTTCLSATCERPSRRPVSDAHRIALERLFQRISEVSSLPGAAQEIVALAGDDATSAEDLRQVIQKDPALAAKVLRRVNSSYFGLSSKVADLKTAIALLGFREVRNICLTVYVAGMFDKPGTYRDYSRKHLWQHCVGTALAAAKIARITSVVPPDEAYVGGLLHHVGTILIDQHLRSHFRQILDVVAAGTATPVAERDILSFDHAQLGEFVTRKWSFPERITDAIGFYAYPNQYAGDHRAFVNVVTLADFLCSRAGHTSMGVANAALPEDEVFASLGIDQFTFQLLWDEVHALLSELATA